MAVRMKPGELRRSDRTFRRVTAFCAWMVLLLIAAFFVRLVPSCRPSLAAFGWRFLITNDWVPARSF